MHLLTILDYISLGVLLIISIAGVVKFSRLTTPVIILTILILVTLVSESIAAYLAHTKKDNLAVYHFYVIVAFWLYSLCYFFLLKRTKGRILILLIPVIFTLFAVINSIGYQRLSDFPSINIIVSNVLTISYSLYYFKYLIDLNPFETLRRNSRFLFNTSVLVYSTLVLFVLGILNYLFAHGKNPVPLIVFNYFMTMGYYIALGITILQDRKPLKEKERT